MHGKISRYSVRTKSGTVINASKKIFELPATSWHDPKMLPQVGLFVEFRCSDNGYTILDCRASSYQDFPKNSVIKEIDFWRTKTDEELKAKEAQIKANIIRKICMYTNYFKLVEIGLDKTHQDCIKSFFRDGFNAISYLEQIQQSSSRNDLPKLNYIILKPFLQKAMNYFIANDKHEIMDNFASEMQVIARLEYSYNYFKTNANINAKKIYKAAFLDEQYNYQGVLQAIEAFGEKDMQIKNKIQSHTMELQTIQTKLDSKTGNQGVLNNRKYELEKNIKKLTNDSQAIQSLVTRLKDMSNKFVEDNFKIFEKVFLQIYKILIEQTKEALDISATLLDDKIYSLSTSSQAIKNIFFRQNINTPFCAATFLGHHIARLNKEKMSNLDTVMYNYYKRYSKSYKNYVIFSENEAFRLDLKMKVFAKSKINCVYIFAKEIEYFTAVNRMKFEICFIDSDLKRTNPKDILQAGASSKINKDIKFVLLKFNQINNLEF